MKTTTKLWTVGVITGFVAFVTFAFTLGHVLTARPPSSGAYSLIAATIVCLAFVSSSCCLSALVIRTLQEDQAAALQLREVGRRLDGGRGNVRSLM